ncbi:hypothetical protein BDV93DRAFT_136587 [Ceratobasidium sp. AG-I]|nr:hypothetical protein BDV93DRAFT_136587 [Ceratobasidium sp. AG-I]
MMILGPKTRMISKAPWEEDTIYEEALSDTETQTDTLSIFAGKLKAKGRSRSKTLTQAKAEKERRFLGGGWGRSSTDTRPSMDSSIGSFQQTPISPRTGSFSDQLRSSGRTPSVFSTSSGASSGPSGAQSLFSGSRPGMAAKFSGGLAINSFGMDSRTTSPAPSLSPTASNFVHPYANLELLPPVHEGGPSRSDSNATLTASTSASPYITPSSSSSSAASPGQDETFLASKKEKRRPPHISVSPLNQPSGLASAAKSPSALSTTHFSPMSPSVPKTPASGDDGLPAGMLGFPGSPAYNLISLEQAQLKVRERSKTTVDGPNPTSPRPKELLTKKSKTSLVGVGGGFSSTIGAGSPSPWTTEDGRARTVSAGSALHSRQKGQTIMSVLAAQSTTSVNIIQGGGIENIPESATGRSSVFTSSTAESINSSGVASGTSADGVPARTLKPKRSGFLKFFKDKTGSNSNSGNPNISAPSAPVHVAHNTIDPPPVPKVPAQFQSAKAPSSVDPDLPRERSLPPVVVSSPGRPRSSYERGRSFSDDSHTSLGDHNGGRIVRDKYLRSNTEPVQRPQDICAQSPPNFNELKLRPVSSAFNGLPEDYLLSSPKVGTLSRGSSEEKADSSFGIEESNVQSPSTPSFPVSARSTYTHVSTASSGSDAFSSSVDPRTPSSFGSFPHGVPRTSTDSQSSTAIIASLREQLRCVRKASRTQINELESQIEELKLELQQAKCDRCEQQSGKERRSEEAGVVNRPRARTGGGSRTTFGA